MLQLLRAKGFYVDRQSGSHVILKTPSDPAKRVVVPLHNKSLKTGTFLGILRQAGVNKDEVV